VPKDAPETWESAVVHNVPILIDDNFLMEAIDGFETDDFEGDAEGFDDADDDWQDQDSELLGDDEDDSEDNSEPEDE
jgi:preprotein translocase subunit Sec63